jgi:hypothetical protein
VCVKLITTTDLKAFLEAARPGIVNMLHHLSFKDNGSVEDSGLEDLDLSALAACPHLSELELIDLAVPVDLTSLGSLPSLQSLKLGWLCKTLLSWSCNSCSCSSSLSCATEALLVHVTELVGSVHKR